MLRLSVIGALALFCLTNASAQYGQPIYQQSYPQFTTYQPGWAVQLIQQPKHSFGVVARGSEHFHVFEFTNNLKSDIVLNSARVSCVCATPKILTPVVKPGEKGQIQVRFNTLALLGDRHSRITVTVTSPEFAEVYLDTEGHVRRDIVVTPGQVDFATVQKGSSAEKSVDIKYAGSGNWQITKVECSNPNLELALAETKREGMRIDYRLSVKLNSSQSPGTISDQIILHTNDVVQKQFPVMVSGRVKALVETQSVVDVGRMQQGKPSLHRIVLKSDQEFVVTSTQTNGTQVKVKSSNDKKRLHILEIEVIPDAEGQLTDEIVVNTDLETNPTKIRVIGEVLAAIETKSDGQ